MKGRKILLALIAFFFLLIGFYIGLALFGHDLLGYLIGFLMAGFMAKLFDKFTKPKEKEHK